MTIARISAGRGVGEKIFMVRKLSDGAAQPSAMITSGKRVLRGIVQIT